MADEQEDTPTEQPQPITGVTTLEAVGLALCTVGSGLIAGAEVHRGRSHVEQEMLLRAAADRLRNLRHFLSESEQLLISIAGYGSGREIQRALPDRVTTIERKPMKAVDGLSGTLLTGAATLVATEPLGPLWSKVAAGVLALAAFIAARLTPVAPKVQP